MGVISRLHISKVQPGTRFGDRVDKIPAPPALKLLPYVMFHIPLDSTPKSPICAQTDTLIFIYWGAANRMSIPVLTKTVTPEIATLSINIRS